MELINIMLNVLYYGFSSVFFEIFTLLLFSSVVFIKNEGIIDFILFKIIIPVFIIDKWQYYLHDSLNFDLPSNNNNLEAYIFYIFIYYFVVFLNNIGDCFSKGKKEYHSYDENPESFSPSESRADDIARTIRDVRRNL
jgi:hypothetical protein